MEITIFLAHFWGSLFMILGGFSVVAKFLRRVINYTEDRTITISTGYITFLLGLATVVAHNIWVWDWPVAITILGWVALLKGIEKVCFPEHVNKVAQIFKTRSVLYGIVIFLIGIFIFWIGEQGYRVSVANFEECVAAGNPIMESYPRQCRHGEQTFRENIGTILGGDRDEHGCIGSAGYSWCEARKKCLRIWEEKCHVNPEQEIQYFLASKYDKPVDEVIVTITRQTESHLSGGLKFGSALSAGGVFLARRAGNMWEIVYEGNGSLDCEKMRNEYSFPDEILKPNFCD